MTPNTLPEPPALPDGLRAREAGSRDVAALAELVRAEELAGSGESSISDAEIAQWFDSARKRERSAIRLVERDGRVVAGWRAFRNFDDKYYLEVAVDRSLPDEQVDELWRVGLAWLQQVALAMAGRLGVTNPRLEIFVYDDNELAERHVSAAGFEKVRTFFEMQMDLDGYTPAPADARVRRADVRGAESPDMRAMSKVITESFRDHFDFTLRPFDEWVQVRLEDNLADFDHWYLAELDGKPVGALMGHNTYVELDNAGYVAVLGVLREGRGKGVAKALLHTSFAHYAAEGRGAVKLHVDAESPTGATYLYESVGMYRRLVGADYHKHLTAS